MVTMTHDQHTAPAPATPHGSHAPAGIPDARAVVGTIDLAVGGMTCASCVARVEKKINKVPGATATVNLAIEQAHVELTDEVDAAALIKAVESAGYTATVMRNSLATRGADAHAGHDTTEMALSGHSMGDGEMDADEDTSAPVPDRGADLRRRLIGAAILSVPVLLLSMIPALQFPGWQWVVTAAALPVVTWSAWPFHRAAARAARHGASTMDTLVSLGVIAASAWSLWAVLLGGAGEQEGGHDGGGLEVQLGGPHAAHRGPREERGRHPQPDLAGTAEQDRPQGPRARGDHAERHQGVHRGGAVSGGPGRPTRRLHAGHPGVSRRDRRERVVPVGGPVRRCG